MARGTLLAPPRRLYVRLKVRQGNRTQSAQTARRCRRQPDGVACAGWPVPGVRSRQSPPPVPFSRFLQPPCSLRSGHGDPRARSVPSGAPARFRHARHHGPSRYPPPPTPYLPGTNIFVIGIKCVIPPWDMSCSTRPKPFSAGRLSYLRTHPTFPRALARADAHPSPGGLRAVRVRGAAVPCFLHGSAQEPGGAGRAEGAGAEMDLGGG